MESKSGIIKDLRTDNNNILNYRNYFQNRYFKSLENGNLTKNIEKITSTFNEHIYKLIHTKKSMKWYIY